MVQRNSLNASCGIIVHSHNKASKGRKPCACPCITAERGWQRKWRCDRLLAIGPSSIVTASRQSRLGAQTDTGRWLWCAEDKNTED
ncbi:hypothetical protein BaRGS_00008072 [Batillaria attramentaria]|uniref:Uncharacterized protein n=1 Tax=Batillaria attramentaria TaxID=370345 RepID=A0ABD0LMY7_9CAEN